MRSSRQLAVETHPHAPTRVSTGQHEESPEAWTVQHYRARATTARHAFGRFPKPGVAGSISAEGATFVLHMANSSAPLGAQRPDCCQVPRLCHRDWLASVSRRHSVGCRSEVAAQRARPPATANSLTSVFGSTPVAALSFIALWARRLPLVVSRSW